MATKWENAELYLLFLSFLTLIWLILRSNIGKNKMSLRRWYTPSFNCLAATIGIDRDRPQSLMEALIISLPFGLPTAIVVAPAEQLFVPLQSKSARIKAKWSPLQSNCLYPSRSRLRWFFIRGSITMADCLFYRVLRAFWAILATRRSTNGCYVVILFWCLSRSLIAIKGRKLFMAGIRLPMHFFEKKQRKILWYQLLSLTLRSLFDQKPITKR